MAGLSGFAAYTLYNILFFETYLPCFCAALLPITENLKHPKQASPKTPGQVRS